jgi:2,5-furandicarboxylate decarboxylase 1
MGNMMAKASAAGEPATEHKGLSLRTFLADLEKNGSTEFLRIKEPVALDYEISAIAMEMDRRKRSPVLLFENVQKTRFPVLANLFGSRVTRLVSRGKFLPAWSL